MEDKIKLIDEIVKRHPSYGTEKGWSWYHGGMEDTGQWYFRKMIDVPIEELQSFLDAIIIEESKPKIPLTPEEERDSKIIHPMSNGGFITELEKKRLEKFGNDNELRIFYGKD